MNRTGLHGSLFNCDPLLTLLNHMLRPRLIDALQISAFLLLVCGLSWSLVQGAENLGYNWQWSRVPRHLYTIGKDGWSAGPLLNGLWITMLITAISLVFSFLIGLLTALMRLSNSIMARALAQIYLEGVRNTPLLIQIFIIYFVFAPILDMERLTSAILALSLFEGAYASEIIRAGILGIPKGQWEASASLGMNRSQNYRYVILPQALRQMLPPLTSQGISLVKDSALVSATGFVPGPAKHRLRAERSPGTAGLDHVHSHWDQSRAGARPARDWGI